MNKIAVLVCAFLSGQVVLSAGEPSGATAPGGASALLVKDSVNWESFLGRHDPVWESLPKTWMEGAFIGNGRLGAMIYKGDGEAEPGADVLAWTIGRSDLYDERSPDYDGKQWTDNCRVPVGRFHRCPVGEVKDGNLRIELWNGEVYGTITTGLKTCLRVASGCEGYVER